MAELRFFDPVASMQQGYAFGSQIRDKREADQRRSQLSSLAQQAYSAPQEQRRDILAQAVGVDPDAGLKLGESLATDDERRNKTMVNMAKMLTSAPEAMRPGLYQQMMPDLQRLGLSALPPQYDDTVSQAAQAIVQAYSGSGPGGRVQSTYVDELGRRVAIMADGTTQILGANAPSIRIMEQEGALPYGVVTSGGRAGGIVPLAGGMAPQAMPSQPQGQPTTFVGGDGSQVNIDPSLPIEVQASIRANEQQWAQAPNMATAQIGPQPARGALPPRLDYQSGGQVGPVRTPTAAERAAATEAAQQAVRLQYAPEMQRIETQGAIERERGVGQVKQELERGQQAPKRIARYEQALATAQNVGTSVNRAMQMIGPVTTGFIGARLRGVEGTPAYNLAAEIETIKANLGFDRLQEMRDNSPTGGALGQVAIQELIALQSTVANLDPNQSGEQLQQNLARIRQHYDRWQAAVQQALAEERTRGAQDRAAPAAPASSGGVLRWNPATGDFE